MTFQQLEAKITRNSKKIAFDIATSFHARVSTAPVVSGDLRAAWKTKRTMDGAVVSNHMCYAPRIWNGRPFNTPVDCEYQKDDETAKKVKQIGAQVPQGLHPIYTEYKKKYLQKIIRIDL